MGGIQPGGGQIRRHPGAESGAVAALLRHLTGCRGRHVVLGLPGTQHLGKGDDGQQDGHDDQHRQHRLGAHRSLLRAERDPAAPDPPARPARRSHGLEPREVRQDPLEIG